MIEVTSVDPVDEATITEEDARRAGASLDLFGAAGGQGGPAGVPRGAVLGGDYRLIALRGRPPTEPSSPTPRADRLDAVLSIGAWTRRTLAIIDRSPEVRAPDLAAEFGRDTASFKRDVRKLKELGLTESLDGYRLSPRGEAVVDDGGPSRGRPRPPPVPGCRRSGAPATRALTAAGLTTLEAVAAVPEQQLAAMHGVGPVALTALRAALAEHGLDRRA